MTSEAIGEPSTNNVSSGGCWPLHKISEPHELNDVLLSVPESSSSNKKSTNRQSSSGGETESSQQEGEPPIPWRSISVKSSHQEDGDSSLRGNQRFFELLLQHQEDYERRTKMEKPLVTVQVLQEWRNQSPPGRFLVAETDTHPPLWEDIGDKKARSKISKALKHLTKTQGSASAIVGSQTLQQHQQSTTADVPTTPTFASQQTTRAKALPSEVEVKKISNLRASSDLSLGSGVHDNHMVSARIISPEEESRVAQTINDPELVVASLLLDQTESCSNNNTREEEEEEKKAGEAMIPVNRNLTPHPPNIAVVPKLPARFRKPERNVRRISEQLHSAQESGTIYGRWSERDQLTTIYERQRQTSTTEVDLVLISGLMGVGKTSLAETLKNPIVDNDACGYGDDEDELEWPFFLHGKFEPCKWSDPNSFFVSIVADFCHQLRQRNDPTLTRKYRNALVDSLKDDIILLSNLVPALDALLKSPHRSSVSFSCTSMGESNSCCPSSERPQDDSFACMAMQRIKEVFGKFLQIVAAVFPEKHSVVVLLDDVHWASEPAIDILTSLVTDKSNRGVLFLGTYRNDEADEPHFKKALLQWDHNQTVRVTNLHLENLKEDSVHLMLAEALSLQEQEIQSLNSLVFSLTKGNPTFITELLRIFQDEGLLRFDEPSHQWTCDLEQIPLVLDNIHSVPDLFKAKVLDLPSAIQESLKIAACLWSTEIDESILKMIDTVGSVSSHLKYADIRGLLTYRNGQYAFVSDGVKQATYDLIPAAEKASYHLKVGQRLWLHLDENENPSFYALLMSQMMMGDAMITEDQDRRSVASLCLRAGVGAAKYVGFQTAWLCLSHGISILTAQKKPWGRENYDLSLSLHNTAIEVCYCNGKYSELDHLLEEVLENARTFEDSLLARSTQIYSLGSRNRQIEAIEVGLKTLKQLGEDFPSMHPPRWRVYLEARRLRAMLRGLSDEDVLKLPRMKDPKKLAAMKILNHVLLYCVYATPNLSVLLSFRMVELTVKSGLSAISSLGFALYGTMLCRFDAIDEGYRYGKLSLKICDKFKKAVWLCRTWAGYYGTIHSRKRSVHEVIGPLRTAYRTGMQTGDIEFSMLNACLVCWNISEIVPLPELEAELREVGGQLLFYGQTLGLVMLKPLWQFALNLMGKCPGDPKILGGELIDDDIEQAKTGSNPHFMLWVGFCRMKLAYIFRDFGLAEQFLDSARGIYNNSNGAMDGAEAMLYECLTRLALARRGKRRLRNILYVKRRLKRLKFWTMHAPVNFLGKQLLLEAELAAVRGDRQKANSHYRSSILHSREGGFFLEEALANEQLGRFYLESNDSESAVPFLKEAKGVYEKWGAAAKVKHFEAEFTELLQ